MTITEKVDDYFKRYGDYFDLVVIKYSKELLYKIIESPILNNVLTQNNISPIILLNTIVIYSQEKYYFFKEEKLNPKEMQGVLNICLFSNEIEDMILNDHISITSINSDGFLCYTPDEYASDYFYNTYNIDVMPGEEFDFSIIENNDNSSISGFSTN